MDTTPPAAAPSADYLGLKEELQKIAAIIDQYPDQLKQRAFELLINAYLARTNSPASPPPVENAPLADQSDTALEETAPANAEEPVAEIASEEISSVESGPEEEGIAPAVDTNEQDESGLESGSRLPANPANSTNMLRQRIRLRTMSQAPWQQPG